MQTDWVITKVNYSCNLGHIVKRIVGNIFNVQQNIRNIFKMSKNLKHSNLNEKNPFLNKTLYL